MMGLVFIPELSPLITMSIRNSCCKGPCRCAVEKFQVLVFSLVSQRYMLKTFVSY